jgi:hypothetical protein
MPETYKSVGTYLNTVGTNTIYNGVGSGTAIVNSVNFSNVNSANGTTVTLEVVKGSTGYSLITNGSVPVTTTLQALDTPIVLEAGNTLRATPGITGYIHAFVSVLEIT